MTNKQLQTRIERLQRLAIKVRQDTAALWDELDRFEQTLGDEDPTWVPADGSSWD